MDASDDLNSFIDTSGCSNSCKLKVGCGEGSFIWLFGLVSVVNVTISFNLEYDLKLLGKLEWAKEFEYRKYPFTYQKKISFNLELVYTMNVWSFYCLSVHETGDEVPSGEMSENLDCAAEPYRIIWLRRVVRWQDWRIYS